MSLASCDADGGSFMSLGIGTMKFQNSNLRARQVLNDCRWAIGAYSEVTSGEPLRVNWVSVITLLRAVGHVLRKVDAAHDPSVSHAAAEVWDEWNRTRPEPKIFWEFIESERNSVVKQYEFGFERTISSTPPRGKAGFRMKADLLSVEGGPLPLQDLPNLASQIKDGPFIGRSELEVAWEALQWWDHVLDGIEGSVGNSRHTVKERV